MRLGPVCRARVPEERPGEATGEGAASAAVEGPALKQSCKEVRLGTMRSYERLLVEMQPSCSRGSQCFGDVSTMGGPPGTEVVVEWSQLEPRR